jgi:Zn-dependent protease
MFTWLILLALIWPALWLIRVVMTTRLLMGLEFRRQKAVAVPLAEIPPHLQEAALPWISQLEQAGFCLLGGWRVEWEGESAFDEEAVILILRTHPIRAVVKPYGESARSGECWISLRTTTGEGFEIVTASYAPEQLVPLPLGMEVEVLTGATMGDLLERHRARIVAAASSAWVCHDLESAVIREQSIRDACFNHLGASGDLTEREGRGFSYRVWPALRCAVQLLRRALALKKSRRIQPAPAVRELSANSQATFDVGHYRQRIALMSGRFSLRTKAVITVGSGLLFAAVLAWRYSPVVALTLVVALAIHEGGHLLGMKWFGYRDTHLLFIPFFGGVAVAHDDKVLKPWQHIVIILLGPLPGIFIGLALLTFTGSNAGPAWLFQAAVTVLVLNAFNLLPILPLDGGQIVDFAFASRFPKARVLFLAVSALGLLLLAVTLDGVKLLVGVAILMLLRLRTEWRLAGVRRAVRNEFPDGGDEEPIVRRLLEHMREPEWKKTPMSQRLGVVQGMQQVLRMSRPGFGTVCFAILGYTAPLWMGAPLAVWAAMRKGEAQVRRAEVRATAAGLMEPVTSPQIAEIAPSENAGVQYAKAEALAGDGSMRRSVGSHEAEVVALLREAAHMRIFIPIPVTERATAGRMGVFAGFGHGGLVIHLTSAADETLRVQQPMEALALAIDALRLVRLMDTAPGWYSWEMHQVSVSAAWTTVEAVLASGVKLPQAMLAELRALTDEGAVISFAAVAMPQGMLRQVHVMDDYALRLGGSRSRWVLVALEKFNPASATLKADTINRAVEVQGYLQSIQRGEWPKFVVDSKNSDGAIVTIAGLSDVLARLRQARVALALVERRQRGQNPARDQAWEAEVANTQHPFTREPMRFTRQGSLDVLTFSAATVRLWGDELNGDGDITWRVPAGL